MHKRGIHVIILIAILLSIASFAITDEDGDTYCPASDTGCPDELDCNDNNPEINPGITEVPGDGIDNDCNGIIDDACTDNDHDSYNSTASANGVSCGGDANIDCDDSNVFVNPGATELCSDSIDNNCNGDTDEEDSACAEATVESDCEINVELVSWINCDTDPINAANNGDTVYMVIMGEGCDEEADVKFKIYEYSDGVGTLEDTIDFQHVFTNIPDNDGNPTDVDVWLAPWVASYMNDDDDTEPEYYFEAELTETSSAFFSQDSGKTEDTLLAVSPCNGCGIECTLDIRSMVGTGNGSSGGITPPCQKSIDCSSVSWSECDASRGKMTRDTSQCAITGTGTMECEQQIRALAVAEKMCSTTGTLIKTQEGPIEEPSCGDGYCDDGEDCPDDCEEEPAGVFPWLWILIAVIVIGAVTTGIIIGYKKVKASAGVAKPEEKKEAMPFAAQKDLESILGYIRAAKGRGYNDSQITESLKKAGWKDEQIKYAFGKINNPQQAAKPIQATNTSTQSASQPVKK